MKKFFNELNEATTISPSGYPDDGSGISSDDDAAPGTTVFGDKMVPVVVPNRLTGETIKYVPAADLGQDWNYDEFDNSMSMGSYKSYSDTLDGLNKLLGDRHWTHTDNRKFRMGQDKWLARRDGKDGGVKQTARLGDNDPIHMELTKKGELNKLKGDKPASNDYWSEVDMGKLDIMERITDYVGVKEPVNEAEIQGSDRKTLARAIMSGRNAKIVIKSYNLQATMTNFDNEVVVTYTNSQDFTLTLVDIADSLGMDWKLTKDGSKQAFRMMK